jgi:hypothetical protein
MESLTQEGLLTMDLADRRPRRQRRKLLIEGLEDRCLLSASASASVPDIVMDSARTSDSKSVTFDYDINNTNTAVAQPIQFEVDRSATSQAGPDAQPIGGIEVDPSGPGGPTLDQNGHPATAPGHHEITVTLPDGLPPEPARPYVVVTADPTGTVPEATRTNNSASFRTYVIGVITHGGVQPKSWTMGPPWEHRLAEQLKADGYDAVIAYNWVAASNHAGAASRQAPRLARKILAAASEFPSNAPVDLHLIGHSEGTVINSQVVLLLNRANAWPPGLQAGYLKMTMLDPHAASNGVRGQQYSVSNGFLGQIARMEIDAFQSRAKDPAVVVPSNVQDAEVFFQHTPVRLSGGSNNGIYNLWGQVPVHGPANYFNLTDPGISHSGKFGVQDWYRLNVAPTLGNGASFVQTDTLTAALVSETPVKARSAAGDRDLVTYAGTAGPNARVDLFAAPAGIATPSLVGRTTAGPDGTWSLTTRPLALGRYRVVAEANAPVGPRRAPAAMKPLAWLGPLYVATP